MNFNDYITRFDKYKNTVMLHPNYRFRGQSDALWKLQPSITRIFKKNVLTKEASYQLEREMINKFIVSGKALLDLRHTLGLYLAEDGKGGNDFLGWLPSMQHYFAPTRCLDWTTSSLVALYFACEDFDKDGMVWIADFKKASEYAEKQAVDFSKICFDPKSSVDLLVFITTKNTNERIESQQGCFSICTNPLLDHEDELNKSEALLEKIVIPKSDKKELLSYLYSMNINARTIFPGIDGLGKSIKEYCELWDEKSKII